MTSNEIKCRILFLGKAGEELVSRAEAYVRQHFPGADVYLGSRGENFPPIDASAPYDYVISYLSQWVIPVQVLQQARCAAINFHPGPPEYPGVGCTNFAIYHQAREFGVTCHHMAAKVDSGPIIKVVRFPLYASDTVLTLTQRCYAHIATLFYEVMDILLEGRELPKSGEKWCRLAYRRREFLELLRLTHDMDRGEIERRIRATTYPGFPAASYDETSLR